MRWRIGNVEIANQVVLAPMAGICNSAYRKIIKEMGCGLIYAEMVSDKAICYDNKKTIDMLYMEEMERPIVQQIFGSDVDSFVGAAKYIEKNMKPDIIDINMGCPVPKVAVRAQAGSALLKDPLKVKIIVSSVVKAVKCPVTVKIRSGWDNDHINAVEIAKVCEEAGAKAICVHGRTRSQGYSGKADWNVIRDVKNNVKIPVIGNGDVTSPEKAKEMLEYTGCDAVMIGRGALGNPWIFREIIQYLKGEKVTDVTNKEKLEIMLKHIDLEVKEKGENVAIKEMRKHLAYYIKNLKNASKLRERINKIDSRTELIDCLNEYFNQI